MSKSKTTPGPRWDDSGTPVTWRRGPVGHRIWNRLWELFWNRHWIVSGSPLKDRLYDKLTGRLSGRLGEQTFFLVANRFKVRDSKDWRRA